MLPCLLTITLCGDDPHSGVPERQSGYRLPSLPRTPARYPHRGALSMIHIAGVPERQDDTFQTSAVRRWQLVSSPFHDYICAYSYTMIHRKMSAGAFPSGLPPL